MSDIYIVQHCQSEHHVNDLTGGWTDTPLTEFGRIQAKTIAQELHELGLKDFELFSSDLKRAKITAEYISQSFKIEIIETQMLREINNGIAANKSKEWANKNKLYKSKILMIDKPLWKEAETPRDLYKRMKTFVETKIKEVTKDLVIVSHGVAIGYLLCLWLKMSPENMKDAFFKGNAGGITKLSKNSYGQNVLIQFNSTAHLKNTTIL